MKIIQVRGGRMVVPEGDSEAAIFNRLSQLLSEVKDIKQLSKKQRTKLQQAWIAVEYSAKEELPRTMGYDRAEVFSKAN